MLGAARVIGALGRYGAPARSPEGAFALSETDTLVRRLARRTPELREIDARQRDWSTRLLATDTL